MWRLGRERGLKKCQSCAESWEHKFENLILLLLAGVNNPDPAARFCSDLISIGHCTEERAANTNELISRRRSSIISEVATQKLSSDSVWQKQRETSFMKLSRHLETDHCLSSHFSVLQTSRHEPAQDEIAARWASRFPKAYPIWAGIPSQFQ